MRTLALVIVASVASCATSSTWSTTLPPGAPPLTGHVEAVRVTVERIHGDPVGGALLGAFIGGVLFRGRHGPSLLGAAAGAGVGAAVSQGDSETRTFRVFVRFDDGSRGEFDYRDFTPFQAGDAVALTNAGLEPIAPYPPPR